MIGKAPGGGSGSGDVTAASTFGTDNSILRADGTDKGAQGTTTVATLSDAGAMVLAGDTDLTTIMGRLRIDSSTADRFFLRHYDNTAAGAYTLRGSPTGQTTLNGTAGGPGVDFSIGDVVQFTLADGALTPETDNDVTLGSAAKKWSEVHGVTVTTSSHATVGGNVVVTGTVDGRDVATDGTKLDGIEAAADVTDATNVAAAGAIMDSSELELGGSDELDGNKVSAALGTLTPGATVTPDADTDGTVWTLTLDQNTTIANPTTMDAGMTFVLKIVQDSSTRTVTWGANYKWPGGTAPVISTGSGEVDIVSGVYDGTNWLCSFVQDMS